MERSGRVVAVTGGSGGIGFAIARRRAALGDQVLITGRRPGPLQSAAEAIGPRVSALACDSADPASAGQIVDAAVERFGRLDVVVANAAHVPPLSSLLDAAEADIDLVWRTNVAGPLRLVRAAMAGPFADHGGVVVMVGSLGGQALQPDMGLYSASKAALHHLTRILAAELGPAVRVNAVAPGLVRTEGARVGWEAAEAMIQARSPMARLGEADDIADAVDFLVDDASSWLTGQILVVDGGASVQLGRRTRRPAAAASTTATTTATAAAADGSRK
jgi:NAD(P)-dependent dehydrogenase (short-subunit alcohol dehydrogenase family)